MAVASCPRGPDTRVLSSVESTGCPLMGDPSALQPRPSDGKGASGTSLHIPVVPSGDCQSDVWVVCPCHLSETTCWFSFYPGQLTRPAPHPLQANQMLVF